MRTKALPCKEFTQDKLEKVGRELASSYGGEFIKVTRITSKKDEIEVKDITYRFDCIEDGEFFYCELSTIDIVDLYHYIL